MNEQNYLQKLLNRSAVEWKTLGEIGEVRMCKRILKSQTTSDGEIPFYKIGTFGKKPDAYISRKLFDEFKEKYSYPKVGDILISASGTIGRTVIFDGKDSYFQDSNIVWIENDEKIILNKYLYYFYQIAKWGVSEGGTIKRLYNENLRKLAVPVPFPESPEKSRAEQARIVRILDAFTALTVELNAELIMRKKQYNYYCEQLLRFEEGEVEWKMIGEITKKIASGHNKARQAEGDFPVYGSTGLLGYTNEPVYSGNLLLVARVGAYAGLVNPVSGHFDVSDNTLIIHPSDSWNVRFAFHQLRHMDLNQYAVGAGQPLITSGMLKKLKVPFPSLNEQTRIARILDKFEIITASISEGLPREIELRQKQFEYYRDLLLSFPKSNAQEVA